MFIQIGDGRTAVDLYHEMDGKGIPIDQMILASVLTSCSHASMVEEGKKIFQHAKSKHKLQMNIQLHTCMVDLLVRTKRIEEAYKYITEQIESPTAVTWMTLHSGIISHLLFMFLFYNKSYIIMLHRKLITST